MKVVGSEAYTSLGQELVHYLTEQLALGSVVLEGDLVAWHLERIEDSIDTVDQLMQCKRTVLGIINELVARGVVFVVRPAEAMWPQSRALALFRGGGVTTTTFDDGRTPPPCGSS